LGRGAAEVAAHEHGADAGLARGRARRRPHVLADERRQVALARDQRARTVFRLLLVLADVDPPLELVGALIDADLRFLALADLDAAEARIVEGVGGHRDHLRPRAPTPPLGLPLRPEPAPIVAPCLPHPTYDPS